MFLPVELFKLVQQMQENVSSPIQSKGFAHTETPEMAQDQAHGAWVILQL